MLILKLPGKQPEIVREPASVAFVEGVLGGASEHIRMSFPAPKGLNQKATISVTAWAGEESYLTDMPTNFRAGGYSSLWSPDGYLRGNVVFTGNLTPGGEARDLSAHQAAAVLAFLGAVAPAQVKA